MCPAYFGKWDTYFDALKQKKNPAVKRGRFL